ncbi:hypothetical protein [Methylosinus sp. Sm6]|uniref:hypothetical protein n=1 Tax=Methylosinus sp. Sm6 TaxID=2866948 RepID=UPI001C98FC76|nr:hypothetical protein [Methylosinus sp. Sm6]MBY6242818.1 hypothetical protein [Methylosinus sp. Sm6]
MRKFWLRAALAASLSRDLLSACAYAVCTCCLAVARGFDRLALACERHARGETAPFRDIMFGWWGRAFTWPAPPRGFHAVRGVFCGIDLSAEGREWLARERSRK